MRTIKELKRIFPADFVYKDGILYYAAYNLNGIFTFDIKTGENRLLSYIPDEFVYFRGGYYRGTVIRNEEIFFVPDCANTFIVYDLKKNNLKKVLLPETIVDYPVYSKFYFAFHDEERVFCIPIRYPGLVEIERNESTILHRNVLLEKKEWIIGDACVWNHHIYMIMFNTMYPTECVLLAFHTKTGEFKYIETKYKNIYHLCEEDRGIWMITELGLVFWNIKAQAFQNYPVPCEIEEKKSLLKIVFFDKKIGIFANDGTLYTFFNIETGEYEEVTYLSDRVCHLHMTNNYITVKAYDFMLFYFNASVGKLFVFNDNQRFEYNLNIPPKYIESYLNNLNLYGKTIDEDMELNVWGHFLQVSDYIKCISQYEKKNSKKDNSIVGKEVFERLKENLK